MEIPHHTQANPSDRRMKNEARNCSQPILWMDITNNYHTAFTLEARQCCLFFKIDLVVGWRKAWSFIIRFFTGDICVMCVFKGPLSTSDL